MILLLIFVISSLIIISLPFAYAAMIWPRLNNKISFLLICLAICIMIIGLPEFIPGIRFHGFNNTIKHILNGIIQAIKIGIAMISIIYIAKLDFFRLQDKENENHDKHLLYPVFFGIAHIIIYLLIPLRHGSPIAFLEFPIYLLLKIFNYDLFYMEPYDYESLDIKILFWGTLFYMLVGYIFGLIIKKDRNRSHKRRAQANIEEHR